MPTIARLIGGAGTGKTAELMRNLSAVLEHGIDPLQVGFCSFTRAARREASERAAALVNGSAEQLETDGWFRTIHSVCFQSLGASRDTTVGNDRKSAKWTSDQLGEEVGAALGTLIDEEGGDFEAATDAGLSLKIWDAARSRLEPLEAAWQRAERCSRRVPPYEMVRATVEKYEQAKRLDGMSDFNDLLGRFAGWKFHPDGHATCPPEGESPPLHVWFFDEQQDTSALLDSVCHRLIESATWVYVVGDPFQSIYAWAGADHTLFQKWDAAKQKIMPKSYRCPRPIHELGERILKDTSDYWDRGIQPADHEGTVEIERFSSSLLSEVTPGQSWLVLARTNWLANKLGSRLTEAGVPWRATRGPGGWPRRSRYDAIHSLAKLSIGQSITAAEWVALLKILPTKLGDETLLKRGTKAEWEEKYSERRKQEFTADNLADAGAAEKLIERITSRAITPLVEGGDEVIEASVRWGEDAVKEPTIRVGTIHSAKGAEADNVLWLTTTTDAVSRSCEDPSGYDEEARCAYVAVTRARRRLIVAVEPNQRHRWRVPA